MITARQIRAARALLAWKQDDLADKVGVSVPTIKRMEKNGLESMKAGTAETLQNVFRAAGVEFINDETSEGAVVRLQTGKSRRKK